MVILEVGTRDGKESSDALRKRGVVPAVFYGPKEEATPISIDSLKLERVWRDAGETTIVQLKGLGEEKDALFHDVQVHPVTGKLLHADFYVLEKGKKIKLNVPLHFEGAAPAEKAGHIVVKTLHEVEIEVAPHELPHSLPVDLSVLEKIGDHITVSQIKLPASATLATDAHEIVASVKEFKEEPVEITPAPATEILTEKKTEEGGAAAPAGDAKAAPAKGAPAKE